MPRPSLLTRLAAVALLLAFLALCACQTTTPAEDAAAEGWNHYGMTGKDAGETVALAAVAGGESNVIVEGVIKEVCPVKGCWMRVADGDAELFVRFQDYSFFVPKNAAGHRVIMHGTAIAQEASVEELRHYAEDAGKSEEEIAAIVVPEMRVTFFADSVYIAGTGLEEPHSE
jgi:hypothetical protein